MPIYEYECTRCNEAFEKLVPSARTPSPACPACGSRQVRKQLSSFSAAISAGKADTCSMGRCPSGACAGGGCPMERN